MRGMLGSLSRNTRSISYASLAAWAVVAGGNPLARQVVHYSEEGHAEADQEEEREEVQDEAD